MFYCYILHSQVLDRFYIGSTSLEADVRLDNHLSGYYGKNKFTAKANDWVLFLAIACSTYHQARLFEAHIKKMKSAEYIRNLKKYPEMIDKLLVKFSDS